MRNHGHRWPYTGLPGCRRRLHRVSGADPVHRTNLEPVRGSILQPLHRQLPRPPLPHDAHPSGPERPSHHRVPILIVCNRRTAIALRRPPRQRHQAIPTFPEQRPRPPRSGQLPVAFVVADRHHTRALADPGVLASAKAQIDGQCLVPLLFLVVEDRHGDRLAGHARRERQASGRLGVVFVRGGGTVRCRVGDGQRRTARGTHGDGQRGLANPFADIRVRDGERWCGVRVRGRPVGQRRRSRAHGVHGPDLEAVGDPVDQPPQPQPPHPASPVYRCPDRREAHRPLDEPVLEVRDLRAPVALRFQPGERHAAVFPHTQQIPGRTGRIRSFPELVVANRHLTRPDDHHRVGGVAQPYPEALGSLFIIVVDDRHTDLLRGLAGVESQRAARRRVVLARRRAAVHGRVANGHCLVARRRQPDHQHRNPVVLVHRRVVHRQPWGVGRVARSRACLGRLSFADPVHRAYPEPVSGSILEVAYRDLSRPGPTQHHRPGLRKRSRTRRMPVLVPRDRRPAVAPRDRPRQRDLAVARIGHQAAGSAGNLRRRRPVVVQDRHLTRTVLDIRALGAAQRHREGLVVLLFGVVADRDSDLHRGCPRVQGQSPVPRGVVLPRDGAAVRRGVTHGHRLIALLGHRHP